MRRGKRMNEQGKKLFWITFHQLEVLEARGKKFDRSLLVKQIMREQYLEMQDKQKGEWLKLKLYKVLVNFKILIIYKRGEPHT